MSYTPEEITELAEITFPYTAMFDPIESYKTEDDFNHNPLAYEIIKAPLRSVPCYLNHYATHVREIAKWRLLHNK